MGLIVVDSSVWIDLFADRSTPQSRVLNRLLDSKNPLMIADLVLLEILQGTRNDRHFDRIRAYLSVFVPITIVDDDVVVHAARNYRTLRDRDITIRKTIDTLIATRCILDGLPLLYSDRDFDPFVEHLGLRSALDIPPILDRK